jgi:hypothetical protein
MNRIFRIKGFPRGLAVRYNPTGYYEYISEEGWLFIFNTDGYYE